MSMLKADGFDDCILGRVERCGQEPYLVYDVDMVIGQLVNDDGISTEEAWEHFYFNIQGAYVGAGTPGFVHPWPSPEFI